ncbi:MAG: ABC transporter substrate-binding protein [Candidatus Dormiibacterota bacterium]
MALVVTGVAVVGHLRTASSETPPPVDYRAAVLTDSLPVSVNPLINSEDPAVAAITPMLYRCLLGLDATAYPAPDLASQLSISLNGLTYTLPLRTGLRWSDGSSITVQDALATIQWVQSSAFPDAAVASVWQGVSASASGNDLVLTLQAPRAALAYDLTQLPILPLGSMSPAGLAAMARHASSPLPTSGPYRVAGEKGGILTLTANPHAAAAPRLGRVQIDAMTSFAAAAKAFAAGTVQAVLATTPAQQAELLHHHGAVARDSLTFGFVDLLFNTSIPGLDDPAVRHAIADAIDREAIVNGPLDGLGTGQYGPIPAGILWLQGEEPALPADPGAAEAGLDAAGWLTNPEGGRTLGGVALHFTLSVPDAAPLPAVAQVVADQLDAVGISVTVAVAPSTGFLSHVLVPGDFQLAIASWDAGADPDLTGFWSSTATPPHGYYVSRGTPDPFLDQDLSALATVTGQPASLVAAAQVVQVMDQDLPAVFLYAPSEGLVVNAAKLSEVIVPAAGDPFADAALWQR